MRELFPEPETLDKAKSYVYLASPYWHKAQAIREFRVKRLCELHAKLIEAFPRTFFYNPLVNSSGCSAPEEYWRQHGLIMLRHASVMIVYCQPGVDTSSGVKLEIAQAESHIPIYYLPDEALTL